MVLFFESNRLGLNNLIFEEENIFEINEIYQLKYSAYKTTKKNFKNNSPILITQKYYKDENYDFLILIPLITPYKKIVYMSFFIQTGTNKNQEIIDKINKDLKENGTKYNNGIKKLLGIDVDSNLLLFIFDKETQEKLIEDKEFSALKYCLKKGI